MAIYIKESIKATERQGPREIVNKDETRARTEIDSHGNKGLDKVVTRSYVGLSYIHTYTYKRLGEGAGAMSWCRAHVCANTHVRMATRANTRVEAPHGAQIGQIRQIGGCVGYVYVSKCAGKVWTGCV